MILRGSELGTRRDGVTSAAACAVIVVAVMLLYGSVLGLFWTYDDAFNLRYAQEQSPLGYFFMPSVWRQLPFTMFTPLLYVAYDIDLALFGERPAPFYAHHLLSLCGAAVALFFVLRSWFSAAISLLATLSVVAAPPMTEWALELMTRHYVEGALLASVATLFYLRAVSKRHSGWAVAAAVVALLAALAKEVFVPLPALWLLLRVATLRERVRFVIPTIAATVVYLAWRWIMLGTLGGGYGWTILEDERFRVYASLPLRLARSFSSGSSAIPAITLAVIAAALAAYLLWRDRGFVARMFFAAVLAVAPLVAVPTQLEPRYLVLLAVVLAVLIAAAMKRFHGGGAIMLGAVALTVLVAANRSAWTPAFEKSARMSSESRALLQLSGSDLLATPAIPVGAAGELKEKAKGSRGVAADVFYDEIFLCEQLDRGRRMWRFDEQRDEVTEQTARIRVEAARFCGSVRSAPLNAAFRHEDEVLTWSLGPYRDGRYRLVLGSGALVMDVPARAAFRVGAVAPPSLRVRYDSPEGWTTYSPDLTLDFSGGRAFSWRR